MLLARQRRHALLGLYQSCHELRAVAQRGDLLVVITCGLERLQSLERGIPLAALGVNYGIAKKLISLVR
jgi:hypothetical protein